MNHKCTLDPDPVGTFAAARRKKGLEACFRVRTIFHLAVEFRASIVQRNENINVRDRFDESDRRRRIITCRYPERTRSLCEFYFQLYFCKISFDDVKQKRTLVPILYNVSET